jgi:hypothetical protein
LPIIYFTWCRCCADSFIALSRNSLNEHEEVIVVSHSSPKKQDPVIKKHDHGKKIKKQHARFSNTTKSSQNLTTVGNLNFDSPDEANDSDSDNVENTNHITPYIRGRHVSSNQF